MVDALTSDELSAMHRVGPEQVRATLQTLQEKRATAAAALEQLGQLSS